MSEHGFTVPVVGTRSDARKATPGTASNDLLLKVVRRQNDITTLLSELVNNLIGHVMVRGGEDWTVSSPYEADFGRIEKLTGEIEDVLSAIVEGEQPHEADVQRIEMPLP